MHFFRSIIDSVDDDDFIMSVMIGHGGQTVITLLIRFMVRIWDRVNISVRLRSLLFLRGNGYHWIHTNRKLVLYTSFLEGCRTDSNRVRVSAFPRSLELPLTSFRLLAESWLLFAVETVTTEYCRANDELNVTSSQSGYIASVMTTDTPHCDGGSHPWVISGRPGQTINLTLYDFAVETPLQSRRPSPAAPVEQAAATEAAIPAPDVDDCVQYCLLEDSGLGETVDANSVVKPIAICSDGRRRIQHVYQSVGNVVKIWITAGVAPTDLKRFVIHYSGNRFIIYEFWIGVRKKFTTVAVQMVDQER